VYQLTPKYLTNIRPCPWLNFPLKNAPDLHDIPRTINIEYQASTKRSGNTNPTESSIFLFSTILRVAHGQIMGLSRFGSFPDPRSSRCLVNVRDAKQDQTKDSNLIQETKAFQAQFLHLPLGIF
jgi:hypothetical protein